MVKAIAEVSHVIGIQTMAEFVENKEIYNLLKEIDVDFAQSYAIHKLCPVEEIFDDQFILPAMQIAITVNLRNTIIRTFPE